MKEEVMKRKKQQLRDDEVRVIKIGEEALFEFIYEKFIDEQSEHLDVDPLSVTNSFSIDWENRQFLFCAHKSIPNNRLKASALIEDILFLNLT